MGHKSPRVEVFIAYHECRPDNRTTKKIVFLSGAPYDMYGAVCVFDYYINFSLSVIRLLPREIRGTSFASYPMALLNFARPLTPEKPIVIFLVRGWVRGLFGPPTFLCIPSSLIFSPLSVRIIIKART